MWALLQVDYGIVDESISRRNTYVASTSRSEEWSDDESVSRMRGPSFDSTGSNTKGGPSYSRVDLCEVMVLSFVLLSSLMCTCCWQMDPEAVACLLRILVRYVRSVIATDSSNFTVEQKDCFQLTVEVCCFMI